MLRKMFADESGFIISSELVLVATLLVIGLIVGMSEVQHAVVAELNDVADAIGAANQSYHYSGFTKRDRNWGWCGVHAHTAGSVFVDLQDACDLNQCMLACDPPVIEAPKTGVSHGGRFGYGYGGGYGGVWSSGGYAGAYGAAGASVSAAAGSAAASGSGTEHLEPVPCPGGCDEADEAAVPCPGGCDEHAEESPEVEDSPEVAE